MMQTTDDRKHFGRVYTPESVVRRMLAPVCATDLSDVRICDPACGTGDFLVPVVEEICRRIRRSPSAGLWNSLAGVAGYDIDERAVRRCRERLRDVVVRVLNSPATFDRIECINALDAVGRDEGRFDYVVGNPPYVRIQHLEAHRRKRIQSGRWTYWRGASDLYIIFFELGLRLLRPGGDLIYIAPSSWLRNDAAAPMRTDIGSNHSLVALYDFGAHQVFPNVITYTCITHIRKGNHAVRPRAFRFDGGRFVGGCRVSRLSDSWAVVLPGTPASIATALTLGDVANIHVGIQTLADRVFILPVVEKDDPLIVCTNGGGTIALERRITRRILKASLMKGGRDKLDRIVIYPYDDAGKLLPESVLRADFPRAHRYLARNKAVLLGRDKGAFNPDRWYAFGREVSIRKGFGRKILTSAMNRTPNFQKCTDPDALFYSGYCVKPKRNVCSDRLLSELNSPAMEEFVRTYSPPYQGGWFSYAKRYIRRFPVSTKVVSCA